MRYAREADLHEDGLDHAEKTRRPHWADCPSSIADALRALYLTDPVETDGDALRESVEPPFTIKDEVEGEGGKRRAVARRRPRGECADPPPTGTDTATTTDGNVPWTDDGSPTVSPEAEGEAER